MLTGAGAMPALSAHSRQWGVLRAAHSLPFSWEIRAVPPADSLGRTIPHDRENHQQSVPGLTFWLQPETFSAVSPLNKYKAEPKTIAVLPRDRNSTLGCYWGRLFRKTPGLQGNMQTGTVTTIETVIPGLAGVRKPGKGWAQAQSTAVYLCIVDWKDGRVGAQAEKQP